MNKPMAIFLAASLAVLAMGTLRNDAFWRTPERRGDRLFQAGDYASAAKTYTDPSRIGMAQYRNGDFEAAAKTFARVPGPVGAFNRGNALLMHGQYDAAIKSYDLALSRRPDWTDATDNRAIAIARKSKIDAAGEHRGEEGTDEVKPDDIAFDQKGDNKQGDTTELAEQSVSDEALRATWLRQVRTTPADFLRAKFAYQAAHTSPTKAGAP